jgi:hypothetical protein
MEATVAHRLKRIYVKATPAENNESKFRDAKPVELLKAGTSK